MSKHEAVDLSPEQVKKSADILSAQARLAIYSVFIFAGLVLGALSTFDTENVFPWLDPAVNTYNFLAPSALLLAGSQTIVQKKKGLI